MKVQTESLTLTEFENAKATTVSFTISHNRELVTLSINNDNSGDRAGLNLTPLELHDLATHAQALIEDAGLMEPGPLVRTPK